jgi:hypothetical protein
MTESKIPRHWAKHFAQCAAREAHDNMMESRRGFYEIEGGGLLIYNNNPYAGDPTMREKEMARTRALLEEHGAEFLARGYYPFFTKYTMTMLFLAPGKVFELVPQIGADSAAWAMRQLLERHRG